MRCKHDKGCKRTRSCPFAGKNMLLSGHKGEDNGNEMEGKQGCGYFISPLVENYIFRPHLLGEVFLNSQGNRVKRIRNCQNDDLKKNWKDLKKFNKMKMKIFWKARLESKKRGWVHKLKEFRFAAEYFIKFHINMSISYKSLDRLIYSSFNIF